MKYDFTTVYDRRGMDALAVDALGQPGGFAPGKPKDGFSVLPMWVADINFACDFIARHFPGVQVAKPAGTYMLFLDCTDWCAAHDKTLEDVLHADWDVGVAWQDGRMVPPPLRHPHESGPDPRPGGGSFQPPERLRICVRLWKIVNVLAAA